MKSILPILIAVACVSCVLVPNEVELGDATATNVLVPGIVNVQPLTVAVAPRDTGEVSVHLVGNATNYDNVSHTLAVMIGRDTVLPDYDTSKFVVIPAMSSSDFNLDFDYGQLGTGFQFNEVVDFGCDGTNVVRVNRVEMNVSETYL